MVIVYQSYSLPRNNCAAREMVGRTVVMTRLVFLQAERAIYTRVSEIQGSETLVDMHSNLPVRKPCMAERKASKCLG
jgi:hypothetical protein